MRSFNRTRNILRALSKAAGGATSSASLAFLDLVSSIKTSDYRIIDKPRGYMKAYKEEVWTRSCINFRARNVAQVPWQLKRRETDGTLGDPITDHPAIIVLNEGNDLNLQGSDVFRRLEVDENVFGGAYWFLDSLNENNIGNPQEIHALRPQFVEPILSGRQGVHLDAYKYSPPNVAPSFFRPQDIVDFHHPNSADPAKGEPIISAIRRTVESSLAAEMFNLKFFKKGGRPDVILSSSEELDEDQAAEIANQYVKNHGSLDENRQSPPAVIGKGATAQLLTSTPKEADFGKTQPLLMLKICAAFGVNPSLLGEQAANRATAWAAKAVFWHETAIPQVRWIAEILNRSYLPKFANSDDLVLVPDFSGVEALKVEWQERAEALSKTTGGVGLLKPDEGRSRLGLSSADGGGVLYGPFSVAPIAEPDNGRE